MRASDCQIGPISTQSHPSRTSAMGSDKHQFSDNTANSLEQNSGHLDNKLNNNGFAVQDQNYNVNVGYCMATVNPASKASYLAPGMYGTGLTTVYANEKRNHWKGNRLFGNSAYNTKQFELDNEGFRCSNNNNYNVKSFNSNGCDNNSKAAFCNTRALNPNNGTNGHRAKYYFHNKKFRRHNDCVDDVHKCAFGLMERFKSKAELFRIHPTLPFSGKRDSIQLDYTIWDYFIAKAQTEEIYISKLELWQKIYLHIGKLYGRYALFMVGSTMSGLATQNSDLDMCLLLRSVGADPRHEAVNCLEIVQKSLINCDFVKSVDLIQAKVPILKCVGVDNGFVVDLNYNNSVGIRNTHLLSCYVQLEWRVRPLVIIVKLWAQANSINDAKHMTISSYSLALMVIHFLQCGINPPVLPCLHTMYPNKFKSDKEIHQIDIDEKIPPYNSSNRQSLSELLMGFLHYYACFNYETDAISVRLASRVSIEKCRFAVSPKNDIHQWKYLCIEEPFDLTNTARSVYDLETFRRIRRVFQESSNILWQTGDLDHILPIKENQS